MNKNSGRLYTSTSLHNGGRRAGYGVVEDDYSEESSGRGRCLPFDPVRFPNDDLDPEELNGPCVVIQEGKRKD